MPDAGDDHTEGSRDRRGIEEEAVARSHIRFPAGFRSGSGDRSGSGVWGAGIDSGTHETAHEKESRRHTPDDQRASRWAVDRGHGDREYRHEQGCQCHGRRSPSRRRFSVDAVDGGGDDEQHPGDRQHESFDSPDSSVTEAYPQCGGAPGKRYPAEVAAMGC